MGLERKRTCGAVFTERRGKGVSVSVEAFFCLLLFRNRKASVQTVWCQTDAEDRALLLEQSHLLHRSVLPSLSRQTRLPQLQATLQSVANPSDLDINHHQFLAFIFVR